MACGDRAPIKTGKYVLNYRKQVKPNPTAVTTLIESLQASMFEAPDH
jgi:hypothetical protein